MELDITGFFNEAMPINYSASVAEIGASAGRITWNRANCDELIWPLLDSDEKRAAFRAFVKESGGWSEAEIAAWDDKELNALCIQWIAGDMRELCGFEMGPHMDAEDWAEYEDQSKNGQVSGRIFMGNDFKIYWSME